MMKRKRRDSGYVVDGLISLNDLTEVLPEIELPETEIETLNGFLLYKLGHLPKDDEEIEIEYGGYRFRPLEIRDQMIQKVKVLPVQPENDEK